MADIPSFYDWLDGFEGSRLGKSALNDLDKHFPPGKESEQTRWLYPLRGIVLASCYGAAMFDRNRDPITEQHNDPSKKERLADTKALKALESQRDAIATLLKFARTYRRAAGIAFGQTMMDLKSRGIGIGCTDGKIRDVVDILDCILETFSSRLVGPIPLVAAGPLLSRFLYGCLHYETPIDDGKHNRLPDVETMLLFDLVQTFRLRSDGICVRQTGELMPEHGKPHFSLATAFVNATFGEIRIKDGEAARNRLKALSPGIGYFPWPVLRGLGDR